MSLWSSISRKGFPWIGVCVIATAMILPGCATKKADGDAEVVFTSHGIVIDGFRGADSVRVVQIASGGATVSPAFTAGRSYISCEFEWTPGATYELSVKGISAFKMTATALQYPEPALIRQINLEQELSRLKVDATEISPSACALSPDGMYCAVGSDRGDVLVYAVRTGELLERMFFSGAYIRSLEFHAGADGRVNLLVGEQSPQGTLRSFALSDDGKLQQQWKFSSSADIGTGRSNPGDPYAWAHMPGVYRMRVHGNGRVTALAVHSTYDEGKALQRSILYCFDAHGVVLWKWPADGLNAVATWFDSARNGDVIGLCAYDGSGRGHVYVIDGTDGSLRASEAIEPLTPHLPSVTFWRSVAVSPSGDVIYAISNDGRAWSWRYADGDFVEIVLGRPVLLDDLPLLISGAGVEAAGSMAIFATGTTYLPWDRSEGQAASQAHPQALKLIGVDATHRAVWQIDVPSLVQNLQPAGEYYIALGYSSDPVYSPGSSGLLLVRYDRASAGIIAAEGVAGRVMHGSPVLSEDGGTLALVELASRKPGSDERTGQHALHIYLW